MSNIHFFTDVELLNQQQANEAFGPLPDANGKNRYQVASLHTASSDPKAFAVCPGTIFVQECPNPDSGGADLINLVLKPEEQPIADLPRVLFYVYRGIRKDSLIDSNGNIATSGNDLADSIHDTQNALNNARGTNEDPPEDILGLHHSSDPGADPIQKVFFKDVDDHQLPHVKGGWHIGDFYAGNFAFQVMVETIGFEPELGMIRDFNHVIEVDELPSSPSQKETFEHWHKKEAILNYLDPCGFYGSQFKEGVRVTESSSSEFNLKDGNDLFDQLLEYDSQAPVFDNRKKVYLDVRNEHDFSLNYFQNYGSDIQAAFDDSSSLNSIDYHREGWPLLRLDEHDFPSETSYHTLRLAFPEADNNAPAAFIAQGFLPDKFPELPFESERFLELFSNGGYAGEVKLALPATGTGDPFSCYVRPKYVRLAVEPVTPQQGFPIRNIHPFDNLFRPFAKKLWLSGGQIKSRSWYSQHYVDKTEESNREFAGSIGLAEDQYNVIWFFIADYILQKEVDAVDGKFNIGLEAFEDFDKFFDYLNHKHTDLKINRGELHISGQMDPVEYIDSFQEPLDAFSDSVKRPEAQTLITIGMSQIQFNDIENTKNTEFPGGFPVFLGIKEVNHDNDDNGHLYFHSELVLRGPEEDGSNIQIKEVQTGIKIYSYV